MSSRPAPPAPASSHESRLKAVLAAGRQCATATTTKNELVLNMIMNDRNTLLSVQGLARFLKMCQVNKLRNEFLNCSDKDMWRAVYEYADARRKAGNRILNFGDDQDIETVLEPIERIDDRVKQEQLSDKAAANEYKRAVIRHVVFFALDFTTDSMYVRRNEGAWLNLVWFQGQVETFLSRTNGSTTNVIKEIKQTMKNVRKENPTYPAIPNEFFLAAIRMIREVNKSNRWAQNGVSRLPELEAEVSNNETY